MCCEHNYGLGDSIVVDLWRFTDKSLEFAIPTRYPENLVVGLCMNQDGRKETATILGEYSLQGRQSICVSPIWQKFKLHFRVK